MIDSGFWTSSSRTRRRRGQYQAQRTCRQQGSMQETSSNVGQKYVRVVDEYSTESRAKFQMFSGLGRDKILGIVSRLVESRQSVVTKSISISWSRIVSRLQSKNVKVCSRNGACCCSQTCERRFGCAAGSKCTLSISWRCWSAAMAAVARKSTPVVCH